jgi:5-hydroxyisourate hydrolase
MSRGGRRGVNLPYAPGGHTRLGGCYAVAFPIADDFRSLGVNLPARPFLDVVRYQFGISDAERHHHLPFKTTPWGYSCFHGA